MKPDPVPEHPTAGDWLHAVIVSYHRLALTERTLDSFLATVSVPFSLVIVDNGSDADDALARIAARHDSVELLPLGENRYPGYATNRGWERMPEQTSLLLRSDNDTLWLPGWCDEMLQVFADYPNVAQFGPIAAGDEEYARMSRWPVGGNSIIRRAVYDEGIRYTEVPWPELRIIEEHQLTLDIWERGYDRAFGLTPGIMYLEDGAGDEEYRRRSFADRGIAS